MKWTSDAQIAVLSVRSSSSPGPGTGSGGLANLEATASQHDRTHG